MSKFFKLLELNYPDNDFNDSNDYDALEDIIDAIAEFDYEVLKRLDDNSIIIRGGGKTFKVSVQEISNVVEDEEFNTTTNPDDDDVKAIKMADKISSNDPNIKRTKDQLNQQIGRTFTSLQNSLRKATTGL